MPEFDKAEGFSARFMSKSPFNKNSAYKDNNPVPEATADPNIGAENAPDHPSGYRVGDNPELDRRLREKWESELDKSTLDKIKDKIYDVGEYYFGDDDVLVDRTAER